MKRRALFTIVAGSIVAAACGIPVDRHPRDITTEDGAPETTAAPEAAPQAGTTRKIYLLAAATSGQISRLHVVRRDVQANPRALFEALVDGLTLADQAARLRSAVPAGTRLVSEPGVYDGIITLDLDRKIFEATGTTLVDAEAQIVFTLSELPYVRGVRLLVDGAPQEWATGDGSLTDRPLTVFDFPERNPTSQPDYPAA